MENFLVLNGHGSRLQDLETFNINTIPENNNIYIFFTKRNSTLENSISNIILAILSYNEDNITTELNILCDKIKLLDGITTEFREIEIKPFEQKLFKLSYDIFIAINMKSFTGDDIPAKLDKPRYQNWKLEDDIFESLIDIESRDILSFENYLLENNLEMRFYTKTIPEFNIKFPLIFEKKKFKSGLNKLTNILNDDKFFTVYDSKLIKIEDIYPMFFKDCVFPNEIEFGIIINNLISYYEQYLIDTKNEQYLENFYGNDEILLDFFIINLNLLQLLNRSEFTICNKNYLMLVCNSIIGEEIADKRADSQGLQGLEKKYYKKYLKYKTKYLNLLSGGGKFPQYSIVKLKSDKSEIPKKFNVYASDEDNISYIFNKSNGYLKVNDRDIELYPKYVIRRGIGIEHEFIPFLLKFDLNPILDNINTIVYSGLKEYFISKNYKGLTIDNVINNSYFNYNVLGDLSYLNKIPLSFDFEIQPGHKFSSKFKQIIELYNDHPLETNILLLNLRFYIGRKIGNYSNTKFISNKKFVFFDNDKFKHIKLSTNLIKREYEKNYILTIFLIIYYFNYIEENNAEPTELGNILDRSIYFIFSRFISSITKCIIKEELNDILESICENKNSNIEEEPTRCEIKTDINDIDKPIKINLQNIKNNILDINNNLFKIIPDRYKDNIVYNTEIFGGISNMIDNGFRANSTFHNYEKLGSNHINITLPYRNSDEVKDFEKRHINLIKALNYLEPLFLACYSTNRNGIFGDNNQYSEISYRFIETEYSNFLNHIDLDNFYINKNQRWLKEDIHSLKYYLIQYVAEQIIQNKLTHIDKLVNIDKESGGNFRFNNNFEKFLESSDKNYNKKYEYVEKLKKIIVNIDKKLRPFKKKKLSQEQINNFEQIKHEVKSKLENYDITSKIGNCKKFGFEIRYFDYINLDYINDFLHLIILLAEYIQFINISDEHPFDILKGDTKYDNTVIGKVIPNNIIIFLYNIILEGWNTIVENDYINILKEKLSFTFLENKTMTCYELLNSIFLHLKQHHYENKDKLQKKENQDLKEGEYHYDLINYFSSEEELAKIKNLPNINELSYNYHLNKQIENNDINRDIKQKIELFKNETKYKQRNILQNNIIFNQFFFGSKNIPSSQEFLNEDILDLKHYLKSISK